MSTKLTKATTKLLRESIRTAAALGIEKLVIDPHSLRGESKDNGTMMLFPFPDGMELEFGSIAVTRVPELISRLRILGDDGDIIPDYKTRDSGEEFVFRLKLKKGRTSIDFKCADPAYVKAPKAFNDPDCFTFTVTKEDVEVMLSAKSVMQADKVTLTSNAEGKVSFIVTASEGDKLVHEIESDLDTECDGSDSFTVTYKTKILFPALREILTDTDSTGITITRRGVMKIELNEIPSYIFSEI